MRGENMRKKIGEWAFWEGTGDGRRKVLRERLKVDERHATILGRRVSATYSLCSISLFL